MCGRCCLIKSCCCGKDLNEGAFAWAIADIIGHVLLLPLPSLMADLNPWSPYFTGWIIFIMFSDAILILGTKSGRPAFLTFWLIVIFINVLGLLALTVITFLGKHQLYVISNVV
jgi:hypothetical protein